MKYRIVVSDELLPDGADEKTEAENHPRIVKGGFTHWSSFGFDMKENCPVQILTFDPSCPRCRRVRKRR
jgi:hypothetical protein